MPAPPASPRARVPTARTVAVDVLLRVARDDAFASAALESALGRAVQLEPRDRALATELAYGTLRVRAWLEARIAARASRKLDAIDPEVLAELLVGGYQLFFLTRVPAFAAVNEAVGAVRAKKGAKVAAFANAVLRRLSEDAAREKADPIEAAVSSAPAWLKEALVESVGEEHARALLGGGDPPAVAIRVNEVGDRDAWVEKIRAAAKDDAEVLAGRVSPYAILVRGGGRTRDLPGYGTAWAIQEEGSQVVALALGARPGDEVLDACAGRGNKTALLARLVAPVDSSASEAKRGAVDAADLYGEKLDRLAAELAKSGLAPRAIFSVDWSLGPGALADRTYDRVLVDAPCSGSGTLRRRPDLASRRTPERLADLAALQGSIALRASRLLRPGGHLVFAVCSVLAAEAEAVVERLLAEAKDLELVPFPGEAARSLAGEASTLRLLPHLHGTDGYFLASFRKVPIASPGHAS